jgi:penicillin-binding protein 1A
MRTIMLLAYTALCGAVISLAGIFLYLDPQIPPAESYRHVRLETPLRVYSSDDLLIAEFGERRRIPVTLDRVPQQFIDALLDTEDKRFYEHSGIDFISLTNDVFGLIRSLIMEGSLGPGASTITMQLARNVSFTLEVTFIRKFKEMLLALQIERELTKDEILELYINLVPFGKRAYGAEAAAQTYYGTSLADLNLAQLAMLAGIPQRPEAGNPINGPGHAITRRNVVLARMFEQGSITRSQLEEARSAPITAALHQRELDVPAPYPAEWVRQQLLGRVPDIYTRGYEVMTTLRAPLQAHARKVLRAGLARYDRAHGFRGAEARLALPESAEATLGQPLDAEIGAQIQAAVTARPPAHDLEPAVVISVEAERVLAARSDGGVFAIPLDAMRWARRYHTVDRRGPPLETPADILTPGDIVRVRRGEDGWLLAQLPDIQGALVSLDSRTGAVLAMAGGYDFGISQYNHALQAARQPGSGFKPFVYSAALANGVTPASMFMDAPLVFEDELLESQYRPSNDNNQYNGPTRLREALYKSINLVSIQVLMRVRAGNVIGHVSRFGFDTRTFPRNTQLAIGGGTMAITPLDMVSAYAVFANGGFLIEPHIIQYVRNTDGDIIYAPVHPVACPECEENEQAETSSAAEPTDLAEIFVEPASLEEVLAENNSQRPDETNTDAPPALRVLDERNVFIMHSMLQDVIRRGTGRRARVLERSDLAGKTGTTNDAADTWFNGYGADVVTSVWVGFPNLQPLGRNAYGSNIPLPIWIDFMKEALDDVDEVQRAVPPGVTTMRIDPETGNIAPTGQSDAIFEYFLEEFVPPRPSGAEQEQGPGTDSIDPEDLF